MFAQYLTKYYLQVPVVEFLIFLLIANLNPHKILLRYTDWVI